MMLERLQIISACNYSTVTEWFGKGVKPKSYITCEIDFLEIILELKDKYNK